MFVFFVKQKTAYEMRISDWSSDVCSSDLVHWHRILGAAQRVAGATPDYGRCEVRMIQTPLAGIPEARSAIRQAVVRALGVTGASSGGGRVVSGVIRGNFAHQPSRKPRSTAPPMVGGHRLPRSDRQ